MNDQVISLRYETSIPRKLKSRLQKGLPPDSWARRSIPSSLKVQATSRVLRVTANTGIEGIYDLRRRLALVRDEECSTMFSTDELSEAPARSRTPEIRYSGIVEEKAVGDRILRCEAVHMDLDWVRGTFWVSPHPQIDRRALALIWELLLPGIATKPKGLPVLFTVTDDRYRDGSKLSMELSELAKTEGSDEPWIAAINAQITKDTKLEPTIIKRPTRPAHGSGKCQTLQTRQTRQEGATFDPVPGPGAGFIAWIANQNFLDQVRDIANSITRSLSGFETEYSSSSRAPLNLLFDWWQQLRPRIAGNDSSVVDWIPRLALFLRIYQGDDLVMQEDREGGLSQAEAANYQRVRDAIDSAYQTANGAWEVPSTSPPPPPWATGIDDEDTVGRQIEDCLESPLVSGDKGLCRYLMTAAHSSISSVFSIGGSYSAVGTDDSRIEELEEAQFWVDVGQPLKAEFPVGQHELEVVDGGLLISLGGISLSLVIDNRELVEALEYENGRIRMTLLVPQASISMTVNPRPRRDVGDTIIDILTLGIFGSLTRAAHVPVEIVTAEARLSFLISSSIDSGELRLDAEFDSDPAQSSIPVITNIFGRIDQNVLDFIAVWIDNQQSTFLELIADRLNAFLNPPSFPWPEIWRAWRGPDLRALPADLDSGLLWAGLRRESIPGGGAAGGDLDGSAAETVAYATSARYLAAWLNRLLASLPASETSLDWEDQLGIELPDLESLPDPEPPTTSPDPFADQLLDNAIPDSCRPPDVDPPSRRYRTRSTNYAPYVEFDGETPRSDAGVFTFTCDVTFDAVEDRPFARFAGLRPPRCFDIGGLPGIPRRPLQLDTAMKLGRRVGQLGLDVGELKSPTVLRHAVSYDFGTTRIGDVNGRLTMAPLESLDWSSANQWIGFTPDPSGPEIPEIPGIPEIPIPDGFGLIFCEEPQCEWRSGTDTVVLHTFLQARVEVTGRLLFGYSDREWIDLEGDEHGLPELMLGVVRDASGNPVLGVEVHILETSGPFEAIDRDLLRQQLATPCLELVRTRLSSNRLASTPDGVKFMIPKVELASLIVPSPLVNAVVLKQKGAASTSSFDAGDFEYKVVGDYLVWENELAETLSGLLQPP